MGILEHNYSLHAFPIIGIDCPSGHHLKRILLHDCSFGPRGWRINQLLVTWVCVYMGEKVLAVVREQTGSTTGYLELQFNLVDDPDSPTISPHSKIHIGSSCIESCTDALFRLGTLRACSQDMGLIRLVFPWFWGFPIFRNPYMSYH